MGPVRGPLGSCQKKEAIGHAYGYAGDLTKPEITTTKISYGRRMLPHGTRTALLRSPHGLFTGC